MKCLNFAKIQEPIVLQKVWFSSHRSQYFEAECGYRFGKTQQGGIFMIANDSIAQYVTTKGSDEEGLGRWS